MDTIINILNTFWDNQNRAIPTVIILGIYVCLFIFLDNKKEALLQRIKHKRNARYSIIVALIFLLLVLIAFDKTHFRLTVTWWIATIIWFLMLLVIYHDMKPMLYLTGDDRSIYHHKRLRHIADELLRGQTDRYEKLLLQSCKGKLSLYECLSRWLYAHPILLDNDAKIQLSFLRCRYALIKQDLETAYEELSKLDETDFYQEEWREILVKKAQCLVFMGNITTAKTALKMAGITDIDKKDEANNLIHSPEVWITLAFMSEKTGDFNKAYEYAIQAKNYVNLSNLPEDRKAKILNDCARYEIIHDSRAEADSDMANAWKHIKKSYTIAREVIAANMINTMLEYDYSEDIILTAFEEYKAIHRPDDISSDIVFFNTNVMRLLKFGHKKECYALIKQFYMDKKLCFQDNKYQFECIKATVFHQLMDGEYEHAWIDEDIVTNPDYYANLSVSDRIFVFKHYYEVLSQVKYRYLRQHKPYVDLYEMILDYFRGSSKVLNSAIDDIDSELRNLRNYNVLRHINLMQSKIFVLSVRDNGSHIKNNLQEYLDLKLYMENHGLILDAIDVGVQLVLDASRPDYIPMTNIITGQTTSYSDYVSSLHVLPPEKNGIFIKYKGVSTDPSCMLPGNPENLDLIHTYTVKVIEEIRKLQNHPTKAEFSLKMINSCLAQAMNNEAKELYSYATKTGKSENVLAPWARIILQDVRNLYENQDNSHGAESNYIN